MMKVEHLEAFNFEGAFRGMRNPMNSWSQSDSLFGHCYTEDFYDYLRKVHSADEDESLDIMLKTKYKDWIEWESRVGEKYCVRFIGPKDMELAQKLIRGGTEHRKFLRQIFVSMDIITSRAILTELDTYKIGTVRNSCSTMHKLFNKDREICLEDFTYHEKDMRYLKNIIEQLNKLRELYFERKDFEYVRRGKLLLPEGFNQKITWSANYEVIHNICSQRAGHRMKEWSTFIDEMHNLPYAGELIFYNN